jgi:hypothetical protein
VSKFEDFGELKVVASLSRTRFTGEMAGGSTLACRSAAVSLKKAQAEKLEAQQHGLTFALLIEKNITLRDQLP